MGHTLSAHGMLTAAFPGSFGTSAKDKKKAKKAAKAGGKEETPAIVEEVPPPPPDPPAQEPAADDFSWAMPTSKKVRMTHWRELNVC